MPPVLAHAPIAMHHFGVAIWSHSRLTAPAILYTHVPATIITSHCRGENRITSAPKRAMSKRDAAAAINSIAQQARPIGIGQSEFLRTQFSAASKRVKITLLSIFESYAVASVSGMY